MNIIYLCYFSSYFSPYSYNISSLPGKQNFEKSSAPGDFKKEPHLKSAKTCKKTPKYQEYIKREAIPEMMKKISKSLTEKRIEKKELKPNPPTQLRIALRKKRSRGIKVAFVNPSHFTKKNLPPMS